MSKRGGWESIFKNDTNVLNWDVIWLNLYSTQTHTYSEVLNSFFCAIANGSRSSVMSIVQSHCPVNK